MKFSRNPSTGVLEAYTDEGVYVGNMSTINVEMDVSAQDGGPGSGNHGHAGRPGKVGGSAPEGGGGGSETSQENKPSLNIKKGGKWVSWIKGSGFANETVIPVMIASASGASKETFQLDDEDWLENAWETTINQLYHDIGNVPKIRADFAAMVMKSATSEHEEEWNNIVYEAFSGKPIQNLTADETKVFTMLLERYKPKDSDATTKQADRLEGFLVQDGDKFDLSTYVYLKNKALGGPDPNSKEQYEEVKEILTRQKFGLHREKIKKVIEEYKKVGGAKSTDEVVDILRDSGVFAPASDVSFYDVDLEAAQDSAASILEMSTAFPFMIGWHGGTVPRKMGKGTYAQTNTLANGLMELNLVYFADKKVLAKEYEDDVKSGFHPKDTTDKAVVIHEFTHGIDTYLSTLNVLDSMPTKDKKFSTILRDRVLKNLGLPLSSVEKELSKYACKDADEWFAEAMAEYFDSPNPRRMAKEAHDELMRILYEEKIMEAPSRSAQDGGPGSGNFGHAGRPGKVGGSGPGGGKGSGSLYRHEKQGVGFFGTRRDWLNGLEGEKQHKAARFLAEKKKDMKDAFDRKKKIEDLWKKGYLTQSEAEQRVNELGIGGLTEKSPVEQYIMQKGDKMDVFDLLNHASEARNWEKNGQELLKRNLTEEERKVFEFTGGKEEHKDIFSLLMAKALGIPSPEPKIPEELLYESGAKERPKKDFDWFGPECKLMGWERHTAFPRIIQIALGRRGPELVDLKTKEEVDDALQEMMNAVGTKDLPDISSTDNALKFVAQAKGIRWEASLKEAVRGNQMEGLTKEETDELLDILKRHDEDNDFDDHPDWAEYGMLSTGKFDEDKRKYILLKAKALGLPDPESKEIVQEKERKKKEEAERKVADFVKNGRDRIAQYQNAGSVFSVKQLLDSSGMFKVGARVDLAGIDLYCARNAAVYADKFVQRFPFLIGQLGGLDNTERGSGNYASCARLYGDGKVALNKSYDFFGSESGVIRTYDDDLRSGWHPKGTTYESVVTHEFAHALGGWLTNHKIFGSQPGTEGQQFESKLRLSVLKKLKMTKALVGQELSRYAEKDSYEWFAEAMAEALHSQNPRPMATECLRQLEEILQKEGLISGPIQRIL